MRGSCSSEILLLFTIILPLVLSSQSVFRNPLADQYFQPQEAYQFGWSVKRVAVIGAGVGGIMAYRELKRDGFDVHIFERDYLPGGTWHFTEEIPLNAPVPNAPIATGDFEPSLPPQGAKFPYIKVYDNQTLCTLQRKAHRAPKAIWESLVTNSAAPTQQIRGFLWPTGTEWAVPQIKVGRYLHAFASWNGVNSNDKSSDISYNTRVELIEKRLDSAGKQIGWILTTKQLEEIEGGLNRATWKKQDFDAVVVVSGRYNAPNMPSIAGLEEWVKKFPDGILHSRQFRRPEDYAGKTVLIVGAAASGSAISREINVHAVKIYQSIRPDPHSTQRPTIVDWIRQVPLNASIVGEIKCFHPPGAVIQESGIELIDGTILRGIDRVIFATGFRYSYPFLPEYHNAELGRTDEAPRGGLQPIVTDGSHLRSLHLDTFYIDNPTLAFVNANTGIWTFTYCEFQSFAISRVWAGKADLPTREEMWSLYREKVDEIGYGNRFSFLGRREERMVSFFRGWLNAAAAKSGDRQIDGLPFEYYQVCAVWMRAEFGDPLLVRNVTIPGAENTVADSRATLSEGDAVDIAAAYNDYW